MSQNDNIKKLHESMDKADAQKAKFDAACEEQWKARGAVVGKAIGNGIVKVNQATVKAFGWIKAKADQVKAKHAAKEQKRVDDIIRQTITCLEEQIFPELKEEISAECAQKLHERIEAHKKAGYVQLKKKA